MSIEDELEIRKKRDNYMLNLYCIYMNSSFTDFNLIAMDKVDKKNISKVNQGDSVLLFRNYLSDVKKKKGFSDTSLLASLNHIPNLITFDTGLVQDNTSSEEPYIYQIMLSVPGHLLYKVAAILYKTLTDSKYSVFMALPSMERQSKGYKDSILIATTAADFQPISNLLVNVLEPYKEQLGKTFRGLPSIAPYACYDMYISKANTMASTLLSISVDVGITEAITKILSYGDNKEKLSSEAKKILRSTWQSNPRSKKALISELHALGLYDSHGFEFNYVNSAEDYYIDYPEMMNYTIARPDIVEYLKRLQG